MATLRPSVFRQTSKKLLPHPRATQQRWATVHDVRYLVTHPNPRRITDKYQEKLNKKAIAEGFKDAEELTASYQEKIQSQNTQASRPPSSTSAAILEHSKGSASSFDHQNPSPHHYSQSPPSQSSQQPQPLSPPGVKTLSSYIDIDKTRTLPQQEIEYLWRLRHARDPQSLCAVIPHDTFARIMSTARRHPQFILPLPREEKGAEIHFLQWTYPTPSTATVLFTHLAEFKLRGEYAQPHTTVTHHLDLQEDKGLILVQGTVTDGRGISVEEGKWLLMCLQKFYGGEGVSESRRRLLEQFSGGDEAFKIEDLLEEAERVV